MGKSRTEIELERLATLKKVIEDLKEIRRHEGLGYTREKLSEAVSDLEGLVPEEDKVRL